MGNRLTRGNLLATLKELKKMPRPKVGVANAPASVQAIVGNSKPVKKVDTHSNVTMAIQHRRVLFSDSHIPMIGSAEYNKVVSEFEDFMIKFHELKQQKDKRV